MKDDVEKDRCYFRITVVNQPFGKSHITKYSQKQLILSAIHSRGSLQNLSFAISVSGSGTQNDDKISHQHILNRFKKHKRPY